MKIDGEMTAIFFILNLFWLIIILLWKIDVTYTFK